MAGSMDGQVVDFHMLGVYETMTSSFTGRALPTELWLVVRVIVRLAPSPNPVARLLLGTRRVKAKGARKRRKDRKDFMLSARAIFETGN